MSWKHRQTLPDMVPVPSINPQKIYSFIEGLFIGLQDYDRILHGYVANKLIPSWVSFEMERDYLSPQVQAGQQVFFSSFESITNLSQGSQEMVAENSLFSTRFFFDTGFYERNLHFPTVSNLLGGTQQFLMNFTVSHGLKWSLQRAVSPVVHRLSGPYHFLTLKAPCRFRTLAPSWWNFWGTIHPATCLKRFPRRGPKIGVLSGVFRHHTRGLHIIKQFQPLVDIGWIISTRRNMVWLVVWNIFFPCLGNNHPNWLIFFRGVQTTNQWWFLRCFTLLYFTNIR